MASPKWVDTASSPLGPGMSKESEIGRHGYETNSPSEISHKQAEDSKEAQHKATVSEEQEASIVNGMDRIFLVLADLKEEALQEIVDWPRRSRSSGTHGERPKIQPEWQEVDDTVKSIRTILHNPDYEDGARLSAEDELGVRELLNYLPRSEEKIGCGVDYIKINRHSHYTDARCFWIVRKDGTETEFSYHKCLKEKVAKEVPGLVDHYEALYQTRSLSGTRPTRINPQTWKDLSS